MNKKIMSYLTIILIIIMIFTGCTGGALEDPAQTSITTEDAQTSISADVGQTVTTPLSTTSTIVVDKE
ncbi:MAG: hypothetical protein K0R46_3010, partial [Herbinix sp.]|nr:hypothetical protein [Herbinix sp.]